MRVSGCVLTSRVGSIRRMRSSVQAFLVLLLLLAIPSAARAAATLQSITVTPGDISMQAGYTQTFTATGHFSDGSSANVSQTASWSVSAVGVATVETAHVGLKGIVSAVAKGSTRLIAVIVV